MSEAKTQEISLTEDEFRIILAVKKKELTHNQIDNFLELFSFLLEKDFFTCRSGKKTAFFDGSGRLRQIRTDQTDWRYQKGKT
jgi:hypothetical protein